MLPFMVGKLCVLQYQETD